MEAAETLGYTEVEWDAELEALEAAWEGASPRGGVAPANANSTTAFASSSSDALFTNSEGAVLILSNKSGTGYKGVCQRGENRFAVTYKGKCEGSYGTPVEAAVRYAHLIATEGGEGPELLPPPLPSKAPPTMKALPPKSKLVPPAPAAAASSSSARKSKDTTKDSTKGAVVGGLAAKGAFSAAAAPTHVTKACGLKLHLSPGSVCSRRSSHYGFSTPRTLLFSPRVTFLTSHSAKPIH